MQNLSFNLKARSFPLRIILSLLILILAVTCCTQLNEANYQNRKLNSYYNGEKFYNPEVVKYRELHTRPKRSSWKLFGYWTSGWLFGFSDWPAWPDSLRKAKVNSEPLQNVLDNQIKITAVGHSTFLIQLPDFNILTDPVWSKRASPVSFKGPERYQPPGINFQDLPFIDLILISHNHYDHLDLETLEDLVSKGGKLAIVPLGNKELVLETGLDKTQELDWWEEYKISTDLKITLVPAQHFSGRTLWDRNETLWGGFVISYQNKNIYYAGDTGYGSFFKEINKKFSTISTAIIPISPYRGKPDTLRYGSIHLNPFEAVQAYLDLNTALFIPCHYDVFQLGPLTFNQPLKDLKIILNTLDIAPHKYAILKPGDSFFINK